MTTIAPLAHDTGAQEDALIAELSAELSATVEAELTEGGSPARLVRLRMRDGSLQVLKLLVDMPGAVDGHDLDSFRVKLRQLDKIRADAPDLAAVYTEKLREFHGQNWAAYTMPFYPSEDVAACLRSDTPDVDRFFTQLGTTLTALADHGWLLAESEVGPGTIADIHADRLERRYWLLSKHLPAEYVEGDRITINGRSCRNPLAIAKLLRDRPELTSGIDPARLHFPAHGDLNTRNVLMTAPADPALRIIDPRGSIANWDVVYDLAKLLFSLTVWDVGLREGFVIDYGADEAVSVAHRGGLYPAYRRSAEDLVEFLENHAGVRAVVAHDPGWRDRLLLSHGFHLLAEAACRLSDIKKRAGAGSAVDLSPIELAAGHYLFGVLFLEDAVAQLEEHGRIDPRRHLSLLPA
ncbi:hypothetical protein [Saccharothrix obliqua]|uniref:hypothetical protein n=1 Tax=Saccharothrix obliqua TaxID=2861747 RepID=UPI001C603992|nr:hypothetical protein [Saccharothrix obliqua]MBW4717273.1 phosphotransferase [Saccharothrix obliqua]